MRVAANAGRQQGQGCPRGWIGHYPNLRAIAGEPYLVEQAKKQKRKPALSQVHKPAATDLADPGIKLAVAVREEDGKPSVRRNRRPDLITFPIGEPFNSGVGQRVVPEI